MAVFHYRITPILHYSITPPLRAAGCSLSKEGEARDGVR
jgi:hypothetical protein